MIDDLDRRLVQAAEKQAELNLKLGELKGETKAEMRAAFRDPEVLVALRAKAWLAHDPEVIIARDLSNVPDGWPAEIDGDEYVANFRDNYVSEAMERVFPASSGEPKPVAETPSVSRLEAYFE